MDRRTDTPSHRDAAAHLKTPIDLVPTSHEWHIADVVIDQDTKEVTRRDNKILEDVEKCIHRAIVGGDLFFAKYAVITTWRNLTYAGAKRPPSGLDHKNPKNTFQVRREPDILFGRRGRIHGRISHVSGKRRKNYHENDQPTDQPNNQPTD